MDADASETWVCLGVPSTNEGASGALGMPSAGKGLPSENMPPSAEEYQAMSDSDKQKVLYAYTRALVNSWSDGDTDRAFDGNPITGTPTAPADPTKNSFGDNKAGSMWSLTYINTVVQGLGNGKSFLDSVKDAVVAPVGTPLADEQAKATAAARNAVYDALHGMSVALETKYDAAGRTIATLASRRRTAIRMVFLPDDAAAPARNSPDRAETAGSAGGA